MRGMQKPDDTNPYRRMRLAAGYTSVDKVLVKLSRELPDSAVPSSATLARIERGAKADVMLTIILAGLYGCGVGELDPEVAEWHEHLKERVVQSSPCNPARQVERLPLDRAA